MPLVTHYQRLNLAESATPEAIENAYRLVVSHLKPTQNTSLQGSDESTRQLALAEQAYAILSDPHRRSEHDAWIHAQRQAPINALAIGKNGATPSLADRTLLDDAHHAPLTKILRKQPVSLLIVLGLVFVASMLESLGVWGEVLAPSNASWASLMPALILCWGLSIMEGRKWFRRGFVLLLASRGAYLLPFAASPLEHGLTPVAGILLVPYVGFLFATASHLLLLDNTEWASLRWLSIPAALGWAVCCYFANLELLLPWLLQGGNFGAPILLGWLANAVPDLLGLALTLKLFLRPRQARLNTQVAWAAFTTISAGLYLAL
jgi:hypothetical protein